MPGVTIEEAVGEPGVARGVQLVQRLPGDEHRHHDRLARTRRHLQRGTRQAVVVRFVLRLKPLAPVRVRLVTSCDFGQEDRGLGGLALAEQDPVFSVRVRPMLEQLPGNRGDTGVLPVTTPLLDLPPEIVDQAVPLAALAGRRRSRTPPDSLAFPFLIAAMGMKDSLGRRPSRISPVGPCGPIS